MKQTWALSSKGVPKSQKGNSKEKSKQQQSRGMQILQKKLLQ